MVMLWSCLLWRLAAAWPQTLKQGSECSCNCCELTLVLCCVLCLLCRYHMQVRQKPPPPLSWPVVLKDLIQRCYMPLGVVMYHMHHMHHMLRFLLLPNRAPWQLAGLLLSTPSFACFLSSLQEAGATPAIELAFTIADGLEYIRYSSTAAA